MVILNFIMVNEQQSIQTSLLVIIIITLETFFFVGNIIPVRALHKEQQLLENYDDLQEFADAVKNGDEEIEDIPLESMKASDIYGDADDSLQDCIDLAAKIGDNLADKDVVNCVEDVNYFKNKLSSNSSVPTTQTSTTDTGTSAATGTNGTSTSNGISTADDEENNLINELVKTGKLTEDEAKELITKSLQSGTDTAPTTDTTTTSNTDTNTNDSPSSNNQDNNNDGPSNTNANNPEDYDDLNDLVDDIRNHVVNNDDISLNTFKDSKAYQGADANTQDCIDLAGKIGDKLSDQEIVHCSEDAKYFENKLSNTDNNNNADDTRK